LRRLGFSRSDIQASLKAANISRQQRRRTSEVMHMSVAQEAFERMKRATLNVTFNRAKKSEEKKLLEPFLTTSKVCTSFAKDDRSLDSYGTEPSSDFLLDYTYARCSETSAHRQHRNSLYIKSN